jgi:hypothetical protein
VKNFQFKTVLKMLLMSALFFAVGVQVSPECIAPIVGGGIGVGLYAIAKITNAHFNLPNGGYHVAGLQVEIWVQDIIEKLWPNQSFAAKAVSHDPFVIQGKIVHIPTAGTPASVKKNLTVFPQAAVKRGDSELTYVLDTYYALPRHIEKIEQYELSYDKRQSVVGADQQSLLNNSMKGLLYRWAPSASGVIETSGNAVQASLPGAAGQRKGMTKDPFHDAKLAFDAADIPTEGRIALLTAYHHQQFLNSLTDVERTGFYATADMKRGVIGQYMGFEVMMRSSVLRYRKVAGVWTVVDEQDDAYAADVDDSSASIFWHQDCVSRAKGDINMFDNPNRAEYYGGIISWNMRLGGRILRPEGVIAVVGASV